jgi:hypothetical protein
VGWEKPERPDLDEIRTIHELHNKFVIWTIDVEFATPRQACPIPFILTVRDVKTDAITLSTTIDYESSTMQYLQDTLEQHQTQFGSTRLLFMHTRYFTKFYHAATTSSMSFGSVGNHFRAAVFSPEMHRIISWYSKADVCVFGCALNGHS